MSFKVINSGIFTTLQDQGRYGYNHLGITHSGAMDEYAYLWGQKLLQTFKQRTDTGVYPYNALEVMVGLKLQATTSIIISITGADLNFKINGVSQPIWQTHFIKEGDTLSFEKRVLGQRAYLVVKGGFIGDKKYGSYSTTLKENIGRKLQRGDVLKTGTLVPNNGSRAFRFRTVQEFIPNYEKPLTLRLLLSYQENYFSQKEKENFFNSEYEITLQSDRMGYKLKGKAINPKHGGIISEAIAFGSVQIPKDGQPIVLLKERQTIGGYPKIGTVLAVDCFKLVQIAVGSKVRFEVIEIEKGEKIMKEFYKFLRKIK